MKRAVQSSLQGLVVLGAVIAGFVAACDSSDDSSGTNGATNDDASTASGDSGSPGITGGDDAGNVVTGGDSGPIVTSDDAGGGSDLDADSPLDATDAADAALPNYCAAQSGLAFCADFDEADSLTTDAGISAWDQVVNPGDLSVATTQHTSGASSLFLNLTDPPNTDQSSKVVKMVTPQGGVAQAIYEFDFYIANLPIPGAGGFLTDFQFSDTPGGGGTSADQFGFRIALFSNATGDIDHLDFEHNAPALNPAPGDYVSPPLANITKGAWNHVKMAISYSATGGDDGGAGVEAKLYVNGSATAAIDMEYPAPFATAPFARAALGMVYAFNGSSKAFGIYFDNVTLKIQ